MFLCWARPVDTATGPSDFVLGLTPLEVETTAELPVTGALPPWLTGTLVRNGPARWVAGHGARADQRYRHWFDGLAMLHRFAFRDGRVEYANRFLRSRGYEHATSRGEIGYAEFGTTPRASVLKRVAGAFSPPEFSDNASVDVLRVGGRYTAVTETPAPVSFDPATLETLGPLAYEDDLPGVITTGHPHLDARTGALVNYTVEFGRSNAYHLYELPAGSLRREPFATVPVDRPAYMHSFAMTERHVVLVEYPHRAYPLDLLAGRSFAESYRWQPGRGTRFTVVERSSGRVVRRAMTSALFCWHHVNAFEDDGDGAGDGPALVLDMPVVPGEGVMQQFFFDRIHQGGAHAAAGELRRYRVPLGERPITYRLLSTAPLEFPRLAERVRGRPYRYAYGVGSAGSLTTGPTDRLVKIDVGTGAATVWSAPRCLPGEPVHVAAPATPGDGGGEQREDDGVLLSVVLDAAARRSFLLVLDAATLTELARVDAPHLIPLGFHGQYFPELTG